MRTITLLQVLACVVVCEACMVARSEGSQVGGCAPSVVSNDTTNATNAGGPFLGSAIGQVFFAPESIITEIDVWRPAGYVSEIGAHIFITGVDSSRSPVYPDVGKIFQNGPDVTVIDSDPPGQLIRVPFVFDPPVVLPHPGYYTMFFQATGCWDGEPWRLLFSQHNNYPYGILWLTGRSTNGCVLRGPAGGGDNDDLVFEAHFCSEATAIVRSSWGKVKVLYR